MAERSRVNSSTAAVMASGGSAALSRFNIESLITPPNRNGLSKAVFQPRTPVRAAWAVGRKTLLRFQNAKQSQPKPKKPAQRLRAASMPASS